MADSYDWAAEAERLLNEIRIVGTVEDLAKYALYRATRNWKLGDAVISAYIRKLLSDDEMRAIAGADDPETKAQAMLARVELRRYKYTVESIGPWNAPGKP